MVMSIIYDTIHHPIVTIDLLYLYIDYGVEKPKECKDEA